MFDTMDEKALSSFAMNFAKLLAGTQSKPAVTNDAKDANQNHELLKSTVESIRETAAKIDELNKAMKGDIKILQKLLIEKINIDDSTIEESPPGTPDISADVNEKKNDKSKKKKKVSAYNLFVGKKIQELVRADPTLSKGERMKKANEAWRNQTKLKPSKNDDDNDKVDDLSDDKSEDSRNDEDEYSDYDEDEDSAEANKALDIIRRKRARLEYDFD